MLIDRSFGRLSLLDGIGGFRVSVAALRGEHQRQVSAGTHAGQADLPRVDLVLFRVVADEPDRAVDVGDDLRNVELRL